MTEPNPQAVLEFWFGDALAAAPEELDAHFKRWFASGEVLDEEIRARFGTWVQQAADGGLEDWRQTAEGTLALIILLDQFPRNIWRGQAQAFTYDPMALKLSHELIASGTDGALHFLQRGFAYLPHQHAEDLATQDAGVAAYEGLVADTDEAHKAKARGFLDSAREHREVVRQFGRFPHRNAILGREASPAEVEYIESGGENYGQDPGGSNGKSA
jgi:uncharacterized protein (DUF924 family)